MTDATVHDELLLVHRHPERGSRDRQVIDEILDAGMVCHLGVVQEGRPVVLPTLYGRDGDHLILHGSAAARTLRAGAAGFPVCVTVTLLDGLVLAPTAFNHSANYRSVVIHGSATLVADEQEKLAALEVLTEHVAPGRWAQVPETTPSELRATSVLTLSLEHAVAKVRAGGTSADPDMRGDAWLGVIPMRTEFGAPEPHELQPEGATPPVWAGAAGVPAAPRPAGAADGVAAPAPAGAGDAVEATSARDPGQVSA